MKIAQTPFSPIVKTLIVTGLMIFSLALTVSAQAQDFSNKPISLIVGFAPGGSNDIAARIIAPYLGEQLKTTVIVENKPGASGMIAGTIAAKASPDGHTLMLSSLSPIIISPQTLKKPPFHTPTDFIAINLMGLTPEAIAVGPTLANVNTLGDLLQLAKTRDITLSSSGVGGLPHLTIELLLAASKGRIIHVPYKGGAPAVTDTVAGHVDGIVMDIPPLMSMIKDGRLKALAVTSDKRVDFLPNIPTAQEFLPNFNVVNWLGIFAPAQTPTPMIAKINAAIINAIARPDVRQKIEAAAIIPSTMESPATFQAFVNTEYSRWGEVLKQAKVELTD